MTKAIITYATYKMLDYEEHRETVELSPSMNVFQALGIIADKYVGTKIWVKFIEIKFEEE